MALASAEGDVGPFAEAAELRKAASATSVGALFDAATGFGDKEAKQGLPAILALLAGLVPRRHGHRRGRRASWCSWANTGPRSTPSRVRGSADAADPRPALARLLRSLRAVLDAQEAVIANVNAVALLERLLFDLGRHAASPEHRLHEQREIQFAGTQTTAGAIPGWIAPRRRRPGSEFAQPGRGSPGTLRAHAGDGRGRAAPRQQRARGHRRSPRWLAGGADLHAFGAAAGRAGRWAGCLRRADARDLARLAEDNQRCTEALAFARERARARQLGIKFFRVEFSPGNDKTTFYFSSEQRVDFRDLVRDLAARFHNRIELRQVGVRDEAKMVGGIGSCGQELCCSTFLPSFAPITIRMAKNQNLALNPARVSGQCGRLKCCLVYEEAQYVEAGKLLPKLGKRVDTPDGPGRVDDLDVLRGRIRVSFPDRPPVTYGAADVQAQRRPAR